MSQKNSRIKTSEGLIELQIMIGDYNVVINVPKETKIGDVFTIVKSYDKIHKQYGPIDSEFIGLASLDANYMVDYWLTNHHFNFVKFRNRLTMKALYSNHEKTDKISVNQFEFIKCLGEGACGCVFLVRSRITGEMFALKRLEKSKINSEQQFKTVFREQKILRTLPKSHHTVKFHASFESLQHFNFLFDFYPGGELFVQLTQKKLTERQCKVYFGEILSAIQFLHKNNVLYRDLKPENIFVDINGHLCIGDFGLSKCGFRQEDITSSNCGSPDYMAPQILENKDYNFSADFYSIGAILYEFLTGFPPYYERTNRNNDSHLMDEKLQRMKCMDLGLESVTKDKNLKNLIKGLLHPDPQLRITDFHIIKNSPWLSDINWKEIEQRSIQVPYVPSLFKTYISEQFLDTEREKIVHKMNQFEIEKFESFQFFDYIAPKSERLLFGKNAPSTSKQTHGIMKKKNTGFLKDKSRAKLKTNNNQTKGNISISLYEKEKHQHRQSRDDTATTTNSNVSGKEHKSHKNTQPKQNFHLGLKKQSSRKHLLKKVPSTHKITTNNSHNVSEAATRRVGTSKEKGLTLKTKNDINKSRIGLGISSTPMHKSKSKEKSQKTLGLGLKKESGYMSNKNKKQILPISSYKIKLM